MQHRKTYRHPGLTMRTRWERAPAAARAWGHEGNRRPHHRWEGFTARRKRRVERGSAGLMTDRICMKWSMVAVFSVSRRLLDRRVTSAGRRWIVDALASARR